MISVPGRPDGPAPRLLEGLAGVSALETLVLSTGSAPTWKELDLLLAEWAGKPHGRLLVLGTLGAHRDARVPRLRALWRIEEKARATGRPVLALRLAPLVGPASPLWLRLRAAGALPRAERALLQPVAEADAVATLRAACAATEEWAGWYDVAGPEAMTLEELAALAGRCPSLPRGAGAWEPSPQELGEQRLCDDGPWRERFAITPRRVSEVAASWA